MRIRFGLYTLGLFALTGCTNGGDNPNHGGDPAGGDNHQSGDGLAPADDFNGDFGPLDDFPIRVPSTHTLTCPGTPPYVGDFIDVDHVCRVDYDTLHADLYFQATPTACVQTMSEVPSEFQVFAFAKVDGESTIRQIAGRYDWGGNHHTDILRFALDGKTYVIGRSSMFFGGRSCSPPDCLLPCNVGATFDTCDEYMGYSVDGCHRVQYGPPPPIPVVCVRVAADGSVPPLLDPWVAQTGYPSYPILPCSGDLVRP
jgi:hypothetical protein